MHEIAIGMTHLELPHAPVNSQPSPFWPFT